MKTDLCVVGMGYIGLPTSAIFAKNGLNVVGVDINEKAVNLINEGKIHIEEPGLPDLVKKVVENGKLRASLKPVPADAYIIAVPTPIHEDYSADINYVISACKNIAPLVKKGDVIIVESTIPPRTMNDIVQPIFEEFGFNVEEDLYIAHCPERVLPGRILIELIENTRIVGGLNALAAKKAAEFYKQVVNGEVIETDALTAEMAKLMENTFRDVNIALANELVKISDKLGVNAYDVIQFANKHPRVNIHMPGPGVGGHCLAVDPYFIVEKTPEESQLIQTARNINNSMPGFVVEKIKGLVKNTDNPKIAVLGITYKGNVDDIRESPAIEVLHHLLANKSFNIAVHDPHVLQENTSIQLHSLEDALKDADLAVVLTDHGEFKNLLTQDELANMRSKIFFDTKKVLIPVEDAEVKLYNFNNVFEIN
ncbi:nucleotide sugar dehydrogenase [Mesobacillus jeotgali]|uniref:nucleotide sugar dehydrogenase n=1 Tax=Mesobacillus jeotgali TaxID=129985 RepID=UPI001CFEC6EB|nr:nucleotide sugar dehydrogenase [Mesobacillus jeotgali]